MGRWWCVAGWLLVACGGRTPPPAPEPTAAPPAEVVPASASPEALYTECRDRVEGPEAAGECDDDADCGRSGCGSEVCTTIAEAGNVMTTCEDRACFAVLDTCGCHDGRCTWTVRPAGPATPQ